MDRESHEVLMMAVAGCTVYGYASTNRHNPNLIAAIRSMDGGLTWQQPIEQTEAIYGLFDQTHPIEGTEKVPFFYDQNGKCLRFVTSLSANRLNKAKIDRK